MKQKRPALPSELHAFSALCTLGLVAHALGLFLVPAAAAAFVVGLDWTLAIKIPTILFLSLLASQGLHLLAFLGHEGFHFSMHPNKIVSSIFGVVLSSMTPGHFDIGFAVSHWNHHKFTNREGDPDAAVFREYHNFFSRFFLARLHASRSYFINTVRLALGIPLPFTYKFPLRPHIVRRLAWLNLASSGLFLGAYIALAIYSPTIGLVAIGLPSLMLIMISGLRPYLEHAGTDHGTFTQARSRTAWITTALFIGTNYHLEHHLYPSVPCYRLPRVHRLLKEQGVLEGAAVETTVEGAYAHTTARSQYPNPA